MNELTSQAREDIVLETIPSPGGDDSPEILSLEYDSRQVGPGALFFAAAGEKADGHSFLDQVVSRGAAAVASERTPPDGFALAWVRVGEIRRAMASLADCFYGSVSSHMPLVGITGTNGKTTTAYLVHSIMQQRAPALLMGTIEVRLGEKKLSHSRLTTPEAIDLQRTLAEAWENGCRSGVLEVSSHALHRLRVLYCRFPVAVFTNLSQDHLDYHGDWESYFQAKSLLFDPAYNEAVRWAVLNADDEWVRGLRTAPDVQRLTFGLGGDSQASPADIQPLRWSSKVTGSSIVLDLQGHRLELTTPLAGRHNVYNVLAAVAATSALGYAEGEIKEGIAALKSVPGRFERVETDHPAHIFVDFAHTPDALENVLQLCRSLAPRRVLCVFGCGGDRDRAKRPRMGEIAARLSDLAIVTSDNPRSEEPASIVDDILEGVPEERACSVETVIERRKAIARVLRLAQAQDIVLIAGKGHETYQEINGERFPFDDRDVIREENPA
ncbi:MAG TPA: UDP-N-acetylmuramoyl-L-alanyl-D-glutamate--2,6-diaminopimelate ligase [Acidobacteriota bacterium]|nr:UDP-N-acetylmuramoyl-L-alanyl-D-glutamate--2,6-diaminopimelate ligase [Acidobacteriota bacterium]